MDVPREEGGRDRSDGATSQGVSGVSSQLQKLREVKEDSSLEPPGEHGPADTLMWDSGLHNRERIISISAVLSYPVWP